MLERTLIVLAVKAIKNRSGSDIPRNIEESTGRFPPTPIDHSAAKQDRRAKSSVLGQRTKHHPIEVVFYSLLDAPAASPNTPVIRSVRLNDILGEQLNIKYILEVSTKGVILSAPYVSTHSNVS